MVKWGATQYLRNRDETGIQECAIPFPPWKTFTDELKGVSNPLIALNQWESDDDTLDIVDAEGSIWRPSVIRFKSANTSGDGVPASPNSKTTATAIYCPLVMEKCECCEIMFSESCLLKGGVYTDIFMCEDCHSSFQ